MATTVKTIDRLRVASGVVIARREKEHDRTTALMKGLESTARLSQKRRRSGIWIVAGMISIFLLSSGCAVGPDFKKPTAMVADEWTESGDPHVVRRKNADYSKWWTLFDDPTLDKLIDIAYRQNLPLQVAGLRILQARANLGIAVGEQYPQTQEATGGLV